MENQFCHSCAAPLNMPDFKGKSDIYCKYCSDEEGNLKSREEAKKGIAGWFMSWQPNLTPETADKRAEHYLGSMPAWADKN